MGGGGGEDGLRRVNWAPGRGVERKSRARRRSVDFGSIAGFRADSLTLTFGRSVMYILLSSHIMPPTTGTAL